MIKYEKSSDISYAIGLTVCFELLNRKSEVATKLFLSPKLKRDETYDKIVALAKSHQLPTIENNEKIFSSLSGKDNVMAIAEFKKFKSDLINSANHAVLVNPSNKGNLGTIIRSVAAFDLGGLAIIEPAADIFDPKVVRGSMGAIFGVPFSLYPSFGEYQKAAGTRFYYPLMLKATTSLRAAKVEKPYSLVFGNEATGLDDSYLSLGTPLLIPQSSKVDSLNLDNAVSIALYEFAK